MIDRSEPAEGQTIDEWWASLETWSKDEHGHTTPNRGLCETQTETGHRVYELSPATPQEIKAAKP